MARILPGRYLVSGLAAALMTFLPIAAQAQLPCAPRDAIIVQLDQRYQERPEATGLTPDGMLVEVFVSDKRSWTILLTSPKGIACIAATGENWEREARKPEVGF